MGKYDGLSQFSSNILTSEQRTNFSSLSSFSDRIDFINLEKHKTYHIKDELLARDGFKKFMKNEPCSFDRCRFSLQCNHIHCVRENCFYVLHSSGQLLSHKRKHERLDSEQAYQQFKLAQKNDNSMLSDSNDIEMRNIEANASGSSKDLTTHFASNSLSSLLSKYNENSENKMESLLNTESMEILQQLQFQKQALLQNQVAATSTSLIGKTGGLDDDFSSDNNNYDPIDASIPKSFIQNANATIGRTITTVELEQLKQIYSAAENAKQKQINALLFAQNNFNSGDQAEPLNLNLKKETKDINNTLLSAVVQKMQNQQMPSNLQQITSIDGLFNRKRGRPPKNRIVEVYGNVGVFFSFLFTSCIRLENVFNFIDNFRRYRTHKIVRRPFLQVLNLKKMAKPLPHYQPHQQSITVFK